MYRFIFRSQIAAVSARKKVRWYWVIFYRLQLLRSIRGLNKKLIQSNNNNKKPTLRNASALYARGQKRCCYSSWFKKTESKFSPRPKSISVWNLCNSIETFSPMKNICCCSKTILKTKIFVLENALQIYYKIYYKTGKYFPKPYHASKNAWNIFQSKKFNFIDSQNIFPLHTKYVFCLQTRQKRSNLTKV